MLEFVLSTEFTVGLLAIITAILFLSIVRIRRASNQFEATLIEFSRWNPEEHDRESFSEYKRSVEEFAIRQGSKSVGMWATFLADVVLKPAGNQPGRAECTADSLDKLRENLLFAYATTHRVSRLGGSLLAGIGFIGTLAIVAAAAVTADPYLHSEKSMSQAISILLSGGGLAFVSSIFGILTSLAFNSFERSEMAKTEVTTDQFLGAIRSRVECKTDRHYLAGIGHLLSQGSEKLSLLSRDVGDHLLRLTEAQLSRTDIFEAHERLGQQISSAMAKEAGSLQDGLKSSLINAMEPSVELHGQHLRAIETLIHQGQNSLTWQERIFEQMQAQAAHAVDQLEATHEVSERLGTQIDAQKETRQQWDAHHSELVRVLTEISDAIATIDEGMEQDFDHLVEQSRETQTALIHYLNDNLESHFQNLKAELEKQGSNRQQEENAALETFMNSKSSIELAIQDLRKVIEESSNRDHKSLTDIRNHLQKGLKNLSAVSLEPSYRGSAAAKVISPAQTRSANWQEESHDGSPSERKKSILKRLNHSELETIEDSLKNWNHDGIEASRHSSDRTDDSHLVRTDILKWIRRARQILEHAHRNFNIVGEQANHLARSCQSTIKDMNKMNESLLDQTEERLTRYGKAFQPLAESNLMICEFITRSIKEAGEFKRSSLFSYRPYIDALAHPLERLAHLENSAESLERGAPSSLRHLRDLEKVWRQDAHLSAIEQISEDFKSDAALDGRLHLKSQEIVGQLRAATERLQRIVDPSILDQVSNWPVVLDQARSIWDIAKQLTGFERRFGRSQSRNEDKFHEAIAQLQSILDQSEIVLGKNKTRKQSG